MRYFVAGVTEEGNEDTKDSGENDEKETKIAKDSKLSDMDYLKAKVVSTTQKPTKKSKKSQNKNNDDSDFEEGKNREHLDEEMETSRRESDHDNSDNDDSNNDEEEEEEKDYDHDGGNDNKNVQNDKPKESDVFGTIKMRGLPFKAKEQHIKDFFAPLTILDIRMLKNNQKKPTGCAFVDFSSDRDIKEALKRDRDCIEGRYIELFRDKGEQSFNQETNNEKPWMKKLAAQGDDKEFESIAEVKYTFPV